MKEAVIEEYRKTLDALKLLLEKKRRANADYRQIDLLNTEIDEVAQVILHLEKGASRYQW